MGGASCLLANSVPLFQDIVSLTGALLSAQCGLVIPCILFLALRWKRPMDSAPLADCLTAVCAWLAGGLGIYLVVAGTYSSITLIAKDLAQGGNAPFSCHDL